MTSISARQFATSSGTRSEPGSAPARNSGRGAVTGAAADLEHPSDFLALGDLLGLFGTNPTQARVAFRDFVAAGDVPVSDTWTWDTVT
ncbi:MAG: hypothetical protein M3R37_08110 [Actinomycetota bacterium]|nr:hypothetical protein [Actinomycetota bacterium]